MKKLGLLFSIFFIGSIIAFGQNKDKDGVEMRFDKTSHDFGKMEYASDATVVFKFRNNSKDAIALTNVKSSCGCTVPTWSKEPIRAGETGEIIVKYNTNLTGTFNKTIQVFSTADNSPVRLRISGSVITPEKKTGASLSQGKTVDNEMNAERNHKQLNSGSAQKSTFPLTKGASLRQSGKKKVDIKELEKKKLEKKKK